MKHTCHAALCECEVPPRLFMCRRHWSLVPEAIRSLIWQHYREGQERDKRPSAEYLEIARRAIRAVALREGIRWELRAHGCALRFWRSKSEADAHMTSEAARAAIADGADLRLIDLGAEELFAEPLEDA